MMILHSASQPPSDLAITFRGRGRRPTLRRIGNTLAILLSLSTSLPAVASFVNGSLDSPGLPVGFPARAFFSPQTSFIDGWSAVAGYDGSYSGSVEYIDGANRGIAGAFVELGYYFGLNAIEQTFSTLPDQSYLVSFWLATDPYNGPPARVRVIVDGTIADFDAPAGTSTGMSMGWRQESFSFVSAGSGSSTLWFGNLIGIPAIDNVQVVLVPEPGLLAWFGLTAMLLFVSGKTDRLR